MRGLNLYGKFDIPALEAPRKEGHSVYWNPSRRKYFVRYKKMYREVKFVRGAWQLVNTMEEQNVDTN